MSDNHKPGPRKIYTAEELGERIREKSRQCSRIKTQLYSLYKKLRKFDVDGIEILRSHLDGLEYDKPKIEFID